MKMRVPHSLRLTTLSGLCFHQKLAVTLVRVTSKLILALAVSFLLMATTLSAAPAYVTGKTTACTATSCIASFTGANAGDLIVLGLFVGNSTSVSSVTDSQGATFTPIGSAQTWSPSNFVERLYYAKNVAAGSHTITVTLSASAYMELHSYDYSGLDTSSPLDASATPQTGTSTTGTSNNLTTTNANDLLFGFFHSDHGVTNTAGSGYTGRTPSGDTYPLGEDKNVTSTSSYTATMSFSGSADYVGFLVAFKAAASGGGGTPPSITTQPSNQAVTAGQTATFSLVATGTAPLSYQWQKNGSNISGATSSTYTTPATTSADNGSTFQVTVSNSYGSANSNIATLTVTSSGPTIYYYIEDSLGSSRVIVQDGQTSACYDADFYPFGGEKPYTNTCPQNYKFEGKERDAETNNDDFDARYYSSTYGRWLSADYSGDPEPVPYANFTNPQTLNLYAMVSDDPESFADLDGHDGCGGSGGSSTGAAGCISGLNQGPKPGYKPGLLGKIGCALFGCGGSGGSKGGSGAEQFGKDEFWGMGKGGANSIIDLLNLVNRPIDYTLGALGSSFRLGQTPELQASTPGEKNAMTGTGIALLLIPGAGEEETASGGTYLYEKIAADGQHLKYGITNNPFTRYTQKELAGGRLKLLARGSRQEMLALERALHENLPLGPEERQAFYIMKQVLKGLSAPPY